MAEKLPKQYIYATGRRKTAVARVRLIPTGSGICIVNGKTVDLAKMTYVDPLRLVGQFGNTDLSIVVAGGGTTGQSDAIRHGIARALVTLDETNKTTLKKAGYLTRDPRERERKKPGLLSARRSPQWSKR